MQIIGIEEENDSIFQTTIKKRFRSIEIIKLETFPKSELKRWAKENNGIVATALPAESTLIKSHFFKVKNSYLLKKALVFQTKLLTSLDPKDYISHSIVQKKTKEGFPVHFFFATKKNLSSHLQNFKNLGCDPDHITSELIALVRFFKSLSPKTRSGFVIHIGMKKTLCLFMKDHLPQSFHVVNTGINHFIEALANDTLHFEKIDELTTKANSLNLLKLDTNYYSALQECLSLWKNQIHQAFYSFMQKEKQDPLPLLITGQTSFFKNLKKFIFSSQFASKLLFPYAQESEKYAVSVGAALDHIAQDHKTVQFRKDDFIAKKTSRKNSFSLATYFILSLVIAFLTYFIGNNFIDNRKELVKKQLVKILHKDPSFQDKSFSQNHDELENILEKSERQIKKDLKPFPFIPNSLNVSDIFTWLQSEETLKESSSNITNFFYELIDYPSVKEPHHPYTAKITIEFQCPDPIKARQFHEKLILGSNLIDPTQEIEWEVLPNNHYRTSFILNNLSLEKIYDEEIY